MDRILVTGACGQLGSELVDKLREKYGAERVLATDIREPENSNGPFRTLDVLDREAINQVIQEENIGQIYHLAAILSANAEKNPELAWEINMKSLLYILDACKEKGIEKIFWPSSIAVFGPGTPKIDTPQETIMDPNTVYGISKLAGERWCEYFWQNYGVDTRSIRYPGIISYKTLPGGGTTDYAIEIFHKAAKNETYDCFLKEDTTLPMMFIDGAIRATLELMEASKESIKVRTSYNIAGTSFDPQTLSDEIKKRKEGFEINYAPDFRQGIADTWPKSIDDTQARQDWNWKPEYGTSEIVTIMLENIQ